MMTTRGWLATSAALLASATSGCDLQEVVAESEADVLVVEAMVHLVRPMDPTNSDEVAGSRIQVFLHRTEREDGGFVRAEPGARVEVMLPGGEVVRLTERQDLSCAPGSRDEANGTCYELDHPESADSPLMALRGGERLDLRIETAGGGLTTSSTRIPEMFELTSVEAATACWVPPEQTVPVTWTESPSAWAYVAETQMFGIADAMAGQGVEISQDPLFLLGVSMGASDTETTFPSEFGLFDRADLDPSLAEVLQKGMPPATRARVSISAVDRNYVGWIRGSSFHPSGRVRIPSVEGDGTGFFGAAVSHWFEVFVEPMPAGLKAQLEACPTG